MRECREENEKYCSTAASAGVEFAESISPKIDYDRNEMEKFEMVREKPRIYESQPKMMPRPWSL